MPKLNGNQAYIDLLKNIRDGYAELKKQKETEYKQYESLAIMEDWIKSLLDSFQEDKTEFSPEEMEAIDNSFEKIQNSYQEITRQNKVMNLHARDMLEGFLRKVDPEEHAYVQSKKTPVKPNTTHGNYEMSVRYLSTMSSFITVMAADDKSWAPYKRMQDLFLKMVMPPIVQKVNGGYSTSFGTNIFAKHSPYLKAGEKEDAFSEPAEMGLEEYETVLREFEASLQDYLSCDDIKQNPMIEAMANAYLSMVRHVLAGDPVLDTQLMDNSHQAIFDAAVNFGNINTLEEKKLAQAGMQGGLWVDVMNLDTVTHDKMIESMKMENRDPHSPEQEAVRQELIAAYKAKHQLVMQQVEAWKNPEDPNYQNINRLMRDGMKDNLHTALDLVGNRGLAANAKTDNMVEALEAGWPMQELITCRQLLAYRDTIRTSLKREDIKIRETQPAEYIKTLENMEKFLDENVKGAYDSPEATRAFVENFSVLLTAIEQAPCTLKAESVKEMLAGVGMFDDPSGARNFMGKMEALAVEATATMSAEQMGRAFRKNVTNSIDEFENLAQSMEGTNSGVWFGSGEFKRISGTMSRVAAGLKDLPFDRDPKSVPGKEELEDLRKLIEAGKKDIDTYLKSKAGKKKFNEAEEDRLDLVIRAKEKLLTLEKAFGLREVAENRYLDEQQQAQRQNDARNDDMNGPNPNLELVTEDVNTKINNKINDILFHVLDEPLEDNEIKIINDWQRRQNLRTNVRDFCNKGATTMKNLAERIGGNDQGSAKVKVSPQEAKNLCIYTYLRGLTSNMNTTGAEKNINFCKQVINTLSNPNLRQSIEAGMEHTELYRNLMENGISKAEMRDMIANAQQNRTLTNQVQKDIKTYREAQAALKKEQPAAGLDKGQPENQIQQPENQIQQPENKQVDQPEIKQPGESQPQVGGIGGGHS